MIRAALLYLRNFFSARTILFAENLTLRQQLADMK